MWKPRNLSIKGKITVIKSVVLPLILYISANVAVPDWFVIKTNALLYHFIWSANMDKVKRATLVNKIEHGGLKMIDLETMIQAQRVMWVKRYFKQSEGTGWTYYLRYMCSKFHILPSDLFKCDLDPEYLYINWPLFYHQMLYAWFHFKGITFEVTPWNLRRKSFIYNKDVLIANSYVRGIYVYWFNAGIRQIHNLFDERGYLIPISVLEASYRIHIDVLSYNSLVSSIPSSWKRCIKNVPIIPTAISYIELPHFPFNNEDVPITLINNKSVYWKLVRVITQPPISLIAWDTLFDETHNDWSCIFRIPYLVTYDSKIQSFQYKILLRIFPCNWYVSKFDRSVDKVCAFCNENVDDLCHYFYECRIC